MTVDRQKLTSKVEKRKSTAPRRKRVARLGAAFRLGFRLCGCLCGDGLIDFEISHFEFAREVEKNGLFFRGQIAPGFFVERVEHVNQFAGGFGIDDGLAGARIGVGAEYHSGIAAQEANKAFESGGALRLLGGSQGLRRLGCGFCRYFAAGFALFLRFFEGLFAELAIGIKGATVYHAKGFFVSVVVFVIRVVF